MFGIGTTELIIIMLVALIVLGPKQLPGIARSLGKALGEFRRVTTDVQRTLNLEAAKIEEDEREQKKAATARKAETPKEPVGEPQSSAKQESVISASSSAALQPSPSADEERIPPSEYVDSNPYDPGGDGSSPKESQNQAAASHVPHQEAPVATPAPASPGAKEMSPAGDPAKANSNQPESSHPKAQA